MCVVEMKMNLTHPCCSENSQCRRDGRQWASMNGWSVAVEPGAMFPVSATAQRPAQSWTALVETFAALLPPGSGSSSQALPFPRFSLLPPPSQCLLDTCIQLSDNCIELSDLLRS